MKQIPQEIKVVRVELKPGEISTGPRKEEENFNPFELRHLKLKFSNNMIKGPVYTGVPIGEDVGDTLNLDLVDCGTENMVKFGPEASSKVEIVVFEKEQLKPVTNWLDGKSLIRGDPLVKLKDGRVSVSHISFKHTNVSMRKREFRLGARAVDNCDIIEAVTEPFFVVDYRSMPKSKKPLKLDDQVWKLPTIGRGGPYHHCLINENIKTVQDFLTLYFLNREKLLTILGRSSLQVRKLDETVNQAKSKLELKRYVYRQENLRVVFTDVGELIGLINEGGHFFSVQQLTPTDKTFGMEMVKRGFEDEHQNSKVLLDDDSFKMLCTASTSPDDFNNYPQQLQPSTSISQINCATFSTVALQHQFDPYDYNFNYQHHPSIWE
ncbi:calmodulin-binding protein 60 B-like isoform X2 [Solanum pennellii]|uniref:Calmodulin-binding protein 60 B-like isoform X2 n=1 Tax=Solanum pennellii TaxID=28526 RepID=A0ABM1GAK8_SOLPN|nr:calmodulin-binding protein 60 B-like isoform X2 [Solanum pennellii]